MAESKVKIPLTSEQLELLIAFERNGSLAALAEVLHKDPSVVSRNLQRLAEAAPVIVKENRRWVLTELGRLINAETLDFNNRLQTLLQVSKAKVSTLIQAKSALILINTQVGLASGQDEVVAQIRYFLDYWRQHQLPVIFVRHTSVNPKSIFHPQSEAAQLIPALQPLADELVLTKEKASILSSVAVSSCLTQNEYDNVFLVGFTGSDCIEASARDLVEQGFETFVVSDASSSLDVTGPDGRLHKAERVHRLSMANINAYSARVFTTREIFDLQK